MSPEVTYGQEVDVILGNSSQIRCPDNCSSTERPAPGELPAKVQGGDRMFTLFSKLPIELRREIWGISLATQQPRIIDIAWMDYQEDWNIRSGARAPSILFASQESRQIAKKSYKPFIFFDRVTGIRVDWSRDIINFRQRAMDVYRRCGWRSQDVFRYCRQMVAGLEDPRSLATTSFDQFERLEVLSVLSVPYHLQPIKNALSIEDIIDVSEDESTKDKPWIRLKRDLEQSFVRGSTVRVVKKVQIESQNFPVPVPQGHGKRRGKGRQRRA
jgi:2EXR family